MELGEGRCEEGSSPPHQPAACCWQAWAAPALTPQPSALPPPSCLLPGRLLPAARCPLPAACPAGVLRTFTSGAPPGATAPPAPCRSAWGGTAGAASPSRAGCTRAGRRLRPCTTSCASCRSPPRSREHPLPPQLQALLLALLLVLLLALLLAVLLAVLVWLSRMHSVPAMHLVALEALVLTCRFSHPACCLAHAVTPPSPTCTITFLTRTAASNW